MKALIVLGILVEVASFYIPWNFLNDPMLEKLASAAARVYSQGSVAEVLAFRGRETPQFILPLLVMVLPRTCGLMALGVATWRMGIFREPERHRGLLAWVARLGGVLGLSASGLLAYSASASQPLGVSPQVLEIGSTVVLPLAYAAGLSLFLLSARGRTTLAPFAALGRMALTNYLAQSVVLSLVFYGFGLGLSGRLGSAGAALIGVALYVIQLVLSGLWLRRFSFGPVEWLWRSFTYGRRQPISAPEDFLALRLEENHEAVDSQHGR